MINGLHHISLTPEEAMRVESKVANQLLKTKKLSLVLDLDQTLIHTCCLPEIEEWIQTLEHQHHSTTNTIHSVKVRGSLLIHHVKLRDGLDEFLENVSKCYELYIYTMGNLCYVEEIVQLIDPESKYFKEDRIITRDDERLESSDIRNRLADLYSDDNGDMFELESSGIGSIYESFCGQHQVQGTAELGSPSERPDKSQRTRPLQAGDVNKEDVSKGRSTILEDFRNNKNRRYEIKDILGHVVEFSEDQHGSRYIQQKLEGSSPDDRKLIFDKIFPKALELMTDVFGNYVIQKFFELCTMEQKILFV